MHGLTASAGRRHVAAVAVVLLLALTTCEARTTAEPATLDAATAASHVTYAQTCTAPSPPSTVTGGQDRTVDPPRGGDGGDYVATGVDERGHWRWESDPGLAAALARRWSERPATRSGSVPVLSIRMPLGW